MKEKYPWLKEEDERRNMSDKKYVDLENLFCQIQKGNKS